ncbi:MAG TPA: gamma-glutamyl-gamma-aminobutyrate hydrolase family protein [Gaiellaceae bacterium]|nr:gamma-glutamyl-gamma-aminobutyrate hydrolase family protein [Gaiellaceae bacterium]
MKPLIGITSYAEEIQWGVWDEEAALIPLSYVRAVEDAGGRPLIVPPSENALEETLGVLDGLILSGGGDVDPGLYGADAHPETDAPRRGRDQAELRLLQEALQRDMPVLAVCRGSQLLNVARGGDLVQHLPDELGHERHKHEPGQFSEHSVRLDPGSRVGALLGEHAPVKSHHHQGYGRLGDGLHEAAWADDGTVEALEDPDKRFAVGVLWHPEEGEDFALFRGLVDEAREFAERRR